MRAPRAVLQYFRSCADCGIVLLFSDSDSDSSHFGRGLRELYDNNQRPREDESKSYDIFYHLAQMLIANLDAL